MRRVDFTECFGRVLDASFKRGFISGSERRYGFLEGGKSLPQATTSYP